MQIRVQGNGSIEIRRREADILNINRKPPYPEQESEEAGDDIIALINPKGGEVENVEIFFFSTRLV